MSNSRPNEKKIERIQKEFFLYHKKMMTVDVGLNTGYCFYTRPNPLNNNENVSIQKNTIRYRGKDKSIESKLIYMREQFSKVIALVNRFQVGLIVLEGVSYWGNSLKSEVSAKTGGLSILSYLVGEYFSLCCKTNAETFIILAQDWKGQMDDDMVRARVEKKTGFDFPKKNQQHEIDAIGMALSIDKKFGR